MVSIKSFAFNSFMVNCYLISDESGESIIIDAACYEDSEKRELSEYIHENHLKIVRNLTTHCHIDHVLGNQFIADTYGVYPEYHSASLPFLLTAKEIGRSFGLQIDSIPEARKYLEDGEGITFGNSELKTLFTPGHADGSVCFFCEKDHFVVTGDVLFKDTIGRTDLPSGDFNLLMNSIHTKLFTLPDDTVVYPGHGPDTTIGFEKANNPFIR